MDKEVKVKKDKEFLECLRESARGEKSKIVSDIIDLKSDEFLEIDIKDKKEYYKYQKAVSSVSRCSDVIVHTKYNKQSGKLYIFKGE